MSAPFRIAQRLVLAMLVGCTASSALGQVQAGDRWWAPASGLPLPWATENEQNPWTEKKPEMPLFRLTCDNAHAPHPFFGRVIYSQDPARALITGRCNDIGAIVMQQFRGIAARAPYFTNGSAKNLRELIDFYDRRYNIRYSEQEKIDLENFLSTL